VTGTEKDIFDRQRQIITDLRRALEHQRQCTAAEHRRVVALETQLEVAWRAWTHADHGRA
jgi:hypothetical protein